MDDRTDVQEIIYATPENLRTMLAQAGDDLDRLKWVIGDAACLLRALVKEHSLDATVASVYIAVSIMSGRAVSPRTVEYYAINAQFYPPPVRDEYSILRMCHFNLARLYDDRWQDILNLAMAKFRANNSVPSEDWLRLMAEQGDINIDITDTDFEPVIDVPDKQWTKIERAKLSIESLVELIDSLPLPEKMKAIAAQKLRDVIMILETQTEMT